jgi:predicted CopG family antitoxin
MTLKKIEPRFIAGPPGTGKTHVYITGLYGKLLSKYSYKKILILSHTNVAAEQILEALFKLKDLKTEEGLYKFPQLQGITKKELRKTIGTIHHYCANRPSLKGKPTKTKLEDHKNLIIEDRRFGLDRNIDIDKHNLYKFRSDAKGRGMTYDEYWRNLELPERNEYKPYNVEIMKELYDKYEKYKKLHNKEDFTDMIERFIDQDVKAPDVDAVIIDECQDSNVPQTAAIEKMATNVKDGHFYLIGDADQTLFEYAGSNPDYFHKLASNPYHELADGLRCSEAINTKCKTVIMPVWDKWGSHRIWTPAKYREEHGLGHVGETIKGEAYSLPYLERGSTHLDILLNKIKNSNQTFLFTYRGTPSDTRVTKFLSKQGLEYAMVDGSPHASKKEINCHYVWPDFVKGKPMYLKQIKSFWNYMGSKVIPKGKGKYDFKDWIDKEYTIDELIDLKLLKPDCKQYTDFDLIRVPHRVTGGAEKLQYIKRVIANGFNNEKPNQIFYGNIHQVKGLTFDNVIVDHTMSMKRAPEDFHTQLRLEYTAYSRGVFDYWELKSTTKRTLGVRSV